MQKPQSAAIEPLDVISPVVNARSHLIIVIVRVDAEFGSLTPLRVGKFYEALGVIGIARVVGLVRVLGVVCATWHISHLEAWGKVCGGLLALECLCARFLVVIKTEVRLC